MPRTERCRYRGGRPWPQTRKERYATSSRPMWNVRRSLRSRSRSKRPGVANQFLDIERLQALVKEERTSSEVCSPGTPPTGTPSPDALDEPDEDELDSRIARHEELVPKAQADLEKIQERQRRRGDLGALHSAVRFGAAAGDQAAADATMAEG